MNRYLLFDSGCGLCSKVAKQIEEETGKILTARSLREVEIQEYLDKAHPDWQWEPALLETHVNGDQVRVYTGFQMRVRLVQLLGIYKAWRIASLVYRSVQPSTQGLERRAFLKYSGSLLAGLAILGVRPLQSKTGQLVTSSGIEARMLSGAELKEAVETAANDEGLAKLRQFLSDKGYNESLGRATAIKVEAKERSTVLLVTIPFDSAVMGGAEAKFVSHGSDADRGVGILHEKDGSVAEVDVYELVSGRVEHTKTLKREGDRIIVQPAEQAGASSFVKGDVSTQSEACNVCQQVCSGVYSVGCGVTGYLACNLVCLSIASVLCPLICAAVYAAVCWWAVGWSCNKICGSPEGLGYC